MVRLVHAFVDLCQQLAEHIGAGLGVDLLILIELGFLFLWVEVDVGLVEVTPHVHLLEGAVVFMPFGLSQEVT